MMMEKNKGYIPPKPNFSKGFDRMCKELNYVPKRKNLIQKGRDDVDVIISEKILFRGKGRGSL